MKYGDLKLELDSMSAEALESDVTIWVDEIGEAYRIEGIREYPAEGDLFDAGHPVLHTALVDELVCFGIDQRDVEFDKTLVKLKADWPEASDYNFRDDRQEIDAVLIGGVVVEVLDKDGKTLAELTVPEFERDYFGGEMA